MTQLTAILDLVNNSTKLMEFETRHNLSQADIDAIKTKATAEADRLKTLQSNTTLVQNCATIDAARQLKDECHQMTRLTELSNLADNQTALQEFQSEHHLTADEMTKFEARAKNATSKLAALQKNSTLVTACKAQKQNQSCKCTRPFRTYSTLYGSVCLEAAQVDLTERECGQKTLHIPSDRISLCGIEFCCLKVFFPWMLTLITAIKGSSQGIIAEATSAAQQTIPAVGTFPIICSTIFVAVLTALTVGLQL
jgi:hypothetical protein